LAAGGGTRLARCGDADQAMTRETQSSTRQEMGHIHTTWVVAPELADSTRSPTRRLEACLGGGRLGAGEVQSNRAASESRPKLPGHCQWRIGAPVNPRVAQVLCGRRLLRRRKGTAATSSQRRREGIWGSRCAREDGGGVVIRPAPPEGRPVDPSARGSADRRWTVGAAPPW
jgi:hypothetical protein